MNPIKLSLKSYVKRNLNLFRTNLGLILSEFRITRVNSSREIWKNNFSQKEFEFFAEISSKIAWKGIMKNIMKNRLKVKYDLLTYVTGLGDGQGCAAGPAEGRDPYPGGTNPPGAPSPAPGAPVALHLPSRDCGHPCPHSLAGPGTTTRPTFHGPVSAERSRGPQCTHFYCGVIPTAVKSHFSHFPPWLPVFFRQHTLDILTIRSSFSPIFYLPRVISVFALLSFV